MAQSDTCKTANITDTIFNKKVVMLLQPWLEDTHTLK